MLLEVLDEVGDSPVPQTLSHVNDINVTKAGVLRGFPTLAYLRRRGRSVRPPPNSARLS